MTSNRTVRITVRAVLAVLALVGLMFILLKASSPPLRVFDIDPSIPTITITAKRLNDSGNNQAASTDAAQGEARKGTPVTAKNPPANNGSQSGAFAHGIDMPTQS